MLTPGMPQTHKVGDPNDTTVEYSHGQVWIVQDIDADWMAINVAPERVPALMRALGRSHQAAMEDKARREGVK